MQLAHEMRTTLLALVFISLASATQLRKTNNTGSPAPAPVSCGKVPTYENSRPADYADARPTKYDPDTKKTVDVVFAAGDTIEFECEPGFSTDGSRDGPKTYMVECTDNGYYKTKGVCLKASKCGALPNITNAMPTGKKGVAPNSLEYACAVGYSLDGEKVIAGGMGKNRFFTIQCLDHGVYSKFEGECQAYAFKPTGEVINMYNQVFEALFTVSCKGSLMKAFGKGEDAPVDSACAKFEDADNKGSCASLVSSIKSDWEAKKSAREEWDKEKDKDWYDAKSPDRPNINDEAMTFCKELWKLLEMPDPSKSK